MKPLYRQIATSLGLGAVLWLLAHHQHSVWLMVLAVAVVLAAELPWGKLSLVSVEERTPQIIAGLSVVALAALYPGRFSEIGIILVYVLWKLWLTGAQDTRHKSLVVALGTQLLAFEAIFLMAAIWNPWRIIILVLTWVSAYLVALRLGRSEGSSMAVVLAAAWGLVAAELAWVFTMWLVSYVLLAGTVIVPQPVIVLTGIGYCFGSIYSAQRQGKLSRSRLTEYLLIAVILIAIVVTGTNWRGII